MMTEIYSDWWNEHWLLHNQLIGHIPAAPPPPTLTHTHPTLKGLSIILMQCWLGNKCLFQHNNTLKAVLSSWARYENNMDKFPSFGHKSPNNCICITYLIIKIIFKVRTPQHKKEGNLYVKNGGLLSKNTENLFIIVNKLKQLIPPCLPAPHCLPAAVVIRFRYLQLYSF